MEDMIMNDKMYLVTGAAGFLGSTVCRQLIEKDDASVGIITSSFHEYRAGLIAEREGYKDIYSIPAESVFPVGIHYTVREFFGVVYLLIR